MFRAGSAASIRPLTNMRWTRAEAVPSGPGWVRVTRISAPASGERPPARVMASSKVTGPVAWKVRGNLTAPATEMGWLLYSATVTVTNGSTIICSSCNALAIADSSSPGIRPCAFTRCLSIGRRTNPSVLTRTVRVSSDGFDRLRGKIGPLSLRRGDGGSCLAGHDGQKARDADEDQDQQQGFTIRRRFWHCSQIG